MKLQNWNQVLNKIIIVREYEKTQAIQDIIKRECGRICTGSQISYTNLISLLRIWKNVEIRKILGYNVERILNVK